MVTKFQRPVSSGSVAVVFEDRVELFGHPLDLGFRSQPGTSVAGLTLSVWTCLFIRLFGRCWRAGPMYPARQDRTVGPKSLPGDDQTQLVETAEGGQIGAVEARHGGSVSHVEVFQIRRVGTLIFGRPRPLTVQRLAERAAPTTPSSGKSQQN